MEFDPLADYTREQGTRILYERLGHEIPRRIVGVDGLGEVECQKFYSFMIRTLIQEKEITERKGRFSGGNLASLYIMSMAMSHFLKLLENIQNQRKQEGFVIRMGSEHSL